jgi:serine/threonine-protein kinase
VAVTPAARARAPGDSLTGRTVIGQYVIRQKLGEGAMGAVYLADQITVDRRAVIKVLHPELRDPTWAARFEVEARAASQLNHPHIVTIYNYGAMEDGTLFLAMEHLDGPTLEQVLAKNKQLAPARAVAIAQQIARALAEAHRHGVVHRDVKPSNVMLVSRAGEQDFVKVLDFGVAKVERPDGTQTGLFCGTPQYASPEQLRGQKLDGRSDLYSLGILTFEMLTGKLPFSASNAVGWAYKHMDEPPPRFRDISRAARNLPQPLESVLHRALAKTPQDRPPSGDAFAEELGRAFASPPPVVAAPPTPVPPARAGSAAEVRLESGNARSGRFFARVGRGLRALWPRRKPRTLFARIFVRERSWATRLGRWLRRPHPRLRRVAWICFALIAIGGAVASAVYFFGAEPEVSPATVKKPHEPGPPNVPARQSVPRPSPRTEHRAH